MTDQDTAPAPAAAATPAPEAAPPAPAPEAAAPESAPEPAAALPADVEPAPAETAPAPKPARGRKPKPSAEPSPLEQELEAKNAARVPLILKSSKLKDAAGVPLRRGLLVEASAARASELIAAGTARFPARGELDQATARGAEPGKVPALD